MKNEPLLKLIEQVTKKPVGPGSYVLFAKKFKQFSGVTISRHTVSNWVNKTGVPQSKLDIAEKLSKAYSKRSENLTARVLRPDIRR